MIIRRRRAQEDNKELARKLKPLSSMSRLHVCKNKTLWGLKRTKQTSWVRSLLLNIAGPQYVIEVVTYTRKQILSGTEASTAAICFPSLEAYPLLHSMIPTCTQRRPARKITTTAGTHVLVNGLVRTPQLRLRSTPYNVLAAFYMAFFHSIRENAYSVRDDAETFKKVYFWRNITL